VGSSRDFIAEKKIERAEKRSQKREAKTVALQAIQKKQQIAEKRRKFNLIPRPTPVVSPLLGSDDLPPTPFFIQKFTRDLYWVLTSPFLLSPHPSSYPTVSPVWYNNLKEPADVLLRHLDKHPDSFFEWALQRRVRSNNLGGYFALLVHFWLMQCRDVRDINVKFQMFDGQRTIGDMDFVFWDDRSQSRSTTLATPSLSLSPPL
jgi:hypothetical protein